MDVPIFTHDREFHCGVEVLDRLGQGREYVPGCGYEGGRCHPDLGYPCQRVVECPVCQDGGRLWDRGDVKLVYNLVVRVVGLALLDGAPDQSLTLRVRTRHRLGVIQVLRCA